MKDYTHITQMENILNTHTETLASLNQLLDFIQSHTQEYTKLLEYYYSDQRKQDLQDDDNHLIPNDLRRGVLSEDAIFDLISDYQETELHLVETAAALMKIR